MEKQFEVFYALESINQFEADHELYKEGANCINVGVDEIYRLILLCQDGDEVGVQVPVADDSKFYDYVFFKVNDGKIIVEYYVGKYGQFRKEIEKSDLMGLLDDFHIPNREELLSGDYEGFSV